MFVLNKNPANGKFAPRSVEGVLIGYPQESKGYRVWMPEKQKAVVARDVKFVAKKLEDMTDEDNITNFLKVDEHSDAEASNPDYLLGSMPRKRQETLDSPTSSSTPNYQPVPPLVI